MPRSFVTELSASHSLTAPVLELRNITKRFGAVTANDHVSLTVRKGEIHAIVGENGAGKSTLMKILSGIQAPDEGQIHLNGKEISTFEPEEAMRAGIGMVHQHFSLVPSLTVAENVVLSNPPRRAGFFLKARAEESVRQLGNRYGLPVDPGRRVADCRVGIQQRVEILKALYRNPDVLILDEPTAVLTPQETGALMDNLRALRASGKTILFITHKLGEVMALADRVTVMRAGRTEGTLDVDATSAADLAQRMVGREVFLEVERAPAHTTQTVLSLVGVSCFDERGRRVLDDVTLDVRCGEIVGVAGVEGNGQSELIEVITGLRTADEGRITPGRMRAHGIAHIPEDRIHQGLATDGTLKENLIMGSHARAPIAKGVWIDMPAARDFASRLIEIFDIRPRQPEVRCGDLSGGNMQKTVIARELEPNPRLIIAAHPTRGVDVGAAEFIYGQLVERRAGAGILLVSSDLDEVMRLSDRIIVMFRGRVMAELSPEGTTGEMLGLLMAGVDPARSAAVVQPSS